MVVDILGSSLLKKMKNKWIFANKKKNWAIFEQIEYTEECGMQMKNEGSGFKVSSSLHGYYYSWLVLVDLSQTSRQIPSQ